MTLPGSRPLGRTLIVGTAPCRAQPLGIMQRLGFECAEVDDVYAAMQELCRRPLVYRSMILALNSLFREELGVIAAVKKRFPHVEVFLTGIEGRQAALAEAMRFGAAGLLGDDGLHPTAADAAVESFVPPPIGTKSIVDEEVAAEEPASPMTDTDEPILTAEELAALLEEHEPTAHGLDRD